MAVIRAIWEFFAERVRLQRWDEGPPDIPVEVEVEVERPRVVGT